MKKPSMAVCLAAALILLTTAAVGCSNGADNDSSADSVQTADNIAPAQTKDDDTQKSADGENAADKNENDNDNDNESSEDADETADDTDSTSESSAEQDSTAAGDDAIGDKLKKTSAVFDGDYTYSVKTVFSDMPDDETTAVVIRQGEKVYITYSEKDSKTPDRAYWFDGTAAYDIDFGMKIFSAREQLTDYNLILSLIENSPEMTEGHHAEDMEGYTAEEYTYAGDTYITVFDFYFDENDGLKKYKVTYTVEGEDDLVESCEVLGLEQSAELDGDPLEGLTDFDAMTEDERLGFCQGVCGEKGISTDNMYEMNITTDDLKRIDYETFTELVYTYGK